MSRETVRSRAFKANARLLPVSNLVSRRVHLSTDFARGANYIYAVYGDAQREINFGARALASRSRGDVVELGSISLIPSSQGVFVSRS